MGSSEGKKLKSLFVLVASPTFGNIALMGLISYVQTYSVARWVSGARSVFAFALRQRNTRGRQKEPEMRCYVHGHGNGKKQSICRRK